jgi:hypothetical protein
LREYYNPEYNFQEYYDINLRLLPNWFSHLFLAFLIFLVPPLIAEKILLSIYVILFVLAFFYFLKAVDKRKNFLGLLIFLFVYNYSLHMGFYNFTFSLSLFLFTLGYWWKHKDNFQRRQTITLTLLLFFMFFCHIISAIVAISSLLFFLLCELSGLGKEIFKIRALGQFFRRKIILPLCSMIPASFLIIKYSLSQDAQIKDFWPWEKLWRYFSSLEFLVYYSDRQFNITMVITVLLGFLILYTMFKGRLSLKGKKVCFPFLSLFLLALYLKAPNTLATAEGIILGSGINPRLSIYPFLVLLPWLNHNFPRILKTALGTIIIFLILLNLGYTTYYYKILNDDLRECTSGIGLVERNKTFLSQSFNNYGRARSIGVFLHALDYYCIEKKGINLSNYEADLGYFPLKFKKGLSRPSLKYLESYPERIEIAPYAKDIDYLLTWALEEESDIYRRIGKYYALIKAEGRLKIFKRR